MSTEKLDEKILERIRRLLAMAKDASSPNEAGIAAKRAQKLMEQYNIDNVESILTDLEDDKNVEADSVIKFKVAGNSKKTPKEVPLWTSRLAYQVARLFDCESRITSAYTATGVVGSKAITFYGYKTDLSVCKWTFEYLLEQIRRFNKEARNRYNRVIEDGGDRYDGVNSRSLLNDYRLGLIVGITGVIEEAQAEKERAKQAETKTGTSLIVVKHNAIAEKFGKFNYGKTQNKRDVDVSAYAEGLIDGRSVKLNQPLPGTDEATGRLTKGDH